jgi:hypothetical protein
MPPFYFARGVAASRDPHAPRDIVAVRDAPAGRVAFTLAFWGVSLYISLKKLFKSIIASLS